MLVGGCAAIVSGGCHVGAGPVIAVSQHGLRAGADLSGGPGPVVGSIGFTGPIVGETVGRTYLTFDPAYMQRIDANRGERFYAIGFGGTIGAAWGADYDGAGLAIGAFAGVVTYPTGGCDARPAYSLMIGVRSLAGIVEVFALPKASWLFAIPCI